ncbi:hypothetical protein FOQG_14539 [Fusarium oxysporum f. sp. raphani 54005]|uniref:Uncharacterized protein n=1 Tax=Fusarium oxysporum f. sp. raphani 54005 TaxID=1089458 RepID=X0BRA3_FUSOX|nr:hypothetical protein FOQG_14539 [Fusarium oxysporum f. sp. raphani 54005]
MIKMVKVTRKQQYWSHIKLISTQVAVRSSSTTGADPKSRAERHSARIHWV